MSRLRGKQKKVGTLFFFEVLLHIYILKWSLAPCHSHTPELQTVKKHPGRRNISAVEALIFLSLLQSYVNGKLMTGLVDAIRESRRDVARDVSTLRTKLPGNLNPAQPTSFHTDLLRSLPSPLLGTPRPKNSSNKFTIVGIIMQYLYRSLLINDKESNDSNVI